MIKPTYYQEYKLYSEHDACIEICSDTKYTLQQALEFVVSLGYEVKADQSWIDYDDMFCDWRGYVGVVSK